MTIPKENSKVWKLCKFIHDNGGAVSMPEFRDQGVQIGLARSKCTPSVVSKHGYAHLEDNKMVLSIHLTNYFNGEPIPRKVAAKVEVVQPRTTTFKEWTGKYNLPTDRIDPTRRYIHLASDVPANTIPWRQ